MQDEEEFKKEVDSRFKSGDNQPKSVVKVLAWHTPEGKEFSRGGKSQAIESTETSMRTPSNQSEHSEMDALDEPYVVVMERGGLSLHHVCASQRMAGYHMEFVQSTVRSITKLLSDLHEHGICQGDFKQRNILKMDRADTPWLLCDMNASADFGSAIGTKTSSAYCPPELARQLVKDSCFELSKRKSSKLISAHASFDIWSLGVVIYELCSGRSLFAQDTANDELVSDGDLTRLCLWHTISDDELRPVFKDAEHDNTIEDARNLIRWCLKGNPADRPSVTEILQHRFLHPNDPSRPAPALRGMKYHVFISHAQQDAAGVARSLYLAWQRLGLHAWLDMEQERLTLDGMRQGVDDSDAFLLLLSANVLFRWFCQQEMLRAIDGGKQFQIIIEEDKRFHAFDRKAWEARDKTQTVFKGQEVPLRIAEQIDIALKHAVPYRRRDYESTAGRYEVCRRLGWDLPSVAVPQWDSSQVKVGVICHSTGQKMLQSLRQELQSRFKCFTDDPALLPSADIVLVLLSAGVMAQGGEPLRLLQEVLQADELQQKDRLAVVYKVHEKNSAALSSTTEGWDFRSAEKDAAPKEVRDALDDHEGLA